MRSITLPLAIFIALACNAQPPSYVPTNGLVGWWPFNGNANDESGNGNNGEVNGASLGQDRTGAANAAYSFDGVNDRITIANDHKLFHFPVVQIGAGSGWLFHHR
jgi:hypothetical protein